MSNVEHAVKQLGPWQAGSPAVLYRNVLILGWYGKANVEAAQEFGTLAESALMQSRQAMISTVHWIDRAVGIPDSPTRDALLKVGNDFRERTACVAAIIVGDGFWASAMRGVVTGLVVLAPRTFAMRTFASAREVLEWLPAEHAERTGVDLDHDVLRAAIERIGKRESGEPGQLQP